jgi:hypothetical protein
MLAAALHEMQPRRELVLVIPPSRGNAERDSMLFGPTDFAALVRAVDKVWSCSFTSDADC